MKKIILATKNTVLVLCTIASTVAMTSCNDFLDKIPDNRAEVNSVEKINKLLTDCYPVCSSAFLGEMLSDNVGDYAWFSSNDNFSYGHAQQQMYKFEDVTPEDWDTPYWLWTYYYRAVATSNIVLENIKTLNASLDPQEAEARLCRAYSMMKLAEVFCMAYDPTKANDYLGLPYPTAVSTELNPQYERGTLEQLYTNIANDIEWAIGGQEPRLNENHYSVPKYHFNMRAAYAFAARFYLYYQKWDKAVTYATKALGSNPANMMRDMSALKNQSTSAEDIFNMYINSAENCKLMLMTAYSLAGRSFASAYARYNHNTYIDDKDGYSANTIFGMSSQSLWYWPNMLYYSGTQGPATFFPKLMEKFEYADKVSGTGTPHIVDCVFTGDETILVRAEANAIQGNYQATLDDVNTWVKSHTKESMPLVKRIELTLDTINGWYDNVKRPIEYTDTVPSTSTGQWQTNTSIRKILTPQGFTITKGDQENLIQLILHFRRLETMSQGLRFYDVKRYGIVNIHYVFDSDPIIFHAGDLRGAVQIPLAVSNAGIQKNPR